MVAACRVEPALSEAARRDVAVERYAPVSLSAAAAALAREVVAQAAPATPARAKALLFAAGRLAAFAEQVGLELEAGVLLHTSVIERFIIEGCRSVSPATRRTLRTNLRALARSLARYPEPSPVALEREHAKLPYSQAQIDGYLRLAACLSTEAKRMRASALICLGAGAGVIAGELREVRGSDVLCRSGGVLVRVSGARARCRASARPAARVLRAAALPPRASDRGRRLRAQARVPVLVPTHPRRAIRPPAAIADRQQAPPARAHRRREALRHQGRRGVVNQPGDARRRTQARARGRGLLRADGFRLASNCATKGSGRERDTGARITSPSKGNVTRQTTSPLTPAL